MRIIPFIIYTTVTVAMVVVLNKSWKVGDSRLPPIGKFLSPQHGFWQNAEAVDQDLSATISFPQLKGKAQVYFDERMVPHVFAENDEDVYFIQGYLHARFRLWQMEFQAFAAAGMVSAIVGEGKDGRVLKYDRGMRRLGMIYAAEKSLEEANRNPLAKAQQDAYTAGVNAWIENLKESELPLEYKLLDYKPEKWTPLKTALFLKYMSYDLAGGDDDLEYTNAKNSFSITDFEALFPAIQDSLKPIVPNTPESPYPVSTAFDLNKPASADSLYFTFTNDTITNILPGPDKDNGSNNWAVNGAKSSSGSPIVCNDPHLGLNLPSLWYEMQLSTPNFNAYGVTFPGAPNIIIGFNDSISFGFTNAGRDVKDYYEIQFRDASMSEYWFDSGWVKTTKRVELVGIRGEEALADTVAYTLFGPVYYDHNFPASEGSKKYYAVRWKAHDPSNETMIFYELNRAKNYADYEQAIKYLTCPGQNPVFGSKNGDIAIWQQGDFPAKWRRQGDFMMPGTDSTYMWKGLIPQAENPHMKNPARGYVSSANQLSVDSTYPYYTGNSFPVYRGLIINRRLDEMNSVSPDDMKALQTDNYNIKAEMGKNILLRLDESRLSADAKKYLSIFKSWNLRNDPTEKGATVFHLWWSELEKEVWSDEINRSGIPMPWPNETTLIESVTRDSAYRFADNISTPTKETIEDLLVTALEKATVQIKQAETDGKLDWAKYKDTKVQHLLKIPALSRLHLPIGGGSGIINATKADHGPSWRMVVHLSANTEAYGVYPGGQSGNPGSPFYDNFVNTWATGGYYTLWVMKKGEESDARIKGVLRFE
ncbi:MAG: penicillin acylase family protein [Chitinophagaceae bacterium]|nr:penicillin acylase family protein [Chitinophagaceae bacterium]